MLSITCHPNKLMIDEKKVKLTFSSSSQERLLLSLLPKFLALEIIADISKQEDSRVLSEQFHKFYIHSYKNVR